MTNQELNELRAVYDRWSTERLGEVLSHRARYTGEAVNVTLDILRQRELPPPLQELVGAVTAERDAAQAAAAPPRRRLPWAVNALMGVFGMGSALAGAGSSVVLFCWAWTHIFSATHADALMGVVMMLGALAVMWTSYNFFKWSLSCFKTSRKAEGMARKSV